MSVFDGIEHVAAEGTSLRQYFLPGNYSVTVDSVFLHGKLGGGKLFIVETTVDESDNPNIKAGDQRNWVMAFGLPTALPRIKSFIGAAMGLCPSRQLQEINKQITLKSCEDAVSSKNPLRGKKLKLVCHNKISRLGKEFTHLMWRPY